MKAHEGFVEDLRASGLRYSVIRPTVYFSDMSEFLRMARSGRVYLIGSGANRLNPIHGADLAKVCVDSAMAEEAEVNVGGPVTYSTREIAELAFSTLGRKPRVTQVPLWLAKAGVKALRQFNRQMSDLAAFFVTAGEGDGVAPATGDHDLGSYYRELASHWGREA